GRSTPPLPFAIQCLSMTEATHVMRTLQCMLEPILPEPSTSNLLRVLSSSSTVRTLLGDDQSGFYAIVIGSPTGVHRTRESVINSQGNLAWPKWHRFETLHEALAYIIVKGDDERLPPLVTVTTDANIPTASPQSLAEVLVQIFHDRLHISSRCLAITSPSRTLLDDSSDATLSTCEYTPCWICVPNLTAALQLQPWYIVHAPNTHTLAPIICTRNSSSLINLGSTSSCGDGHPIIYTHERNLLGIILSHHHYVQAPSRNCHQAQILGDHAARYLIAHGYTLPAIDTIIQIWGAVTSAGDFSHRLSQHGLALTEGTYLWELINIT
ncbi:hypothetical protein SCLCIDRAFT_113865, partial [Scleroderma citrinum Foug A]